MIRSSNKCLAALLLLALREAPAQLQQTSPLGNALVTIEHFGSPNFGRISGMLRDSRGFLWFGTSNGLCRYDGYDVRVYDNIASLDTLGSLQNRITVILNNPDGSLLLGTWNGIWNFDPLAAHFEPILKEVPLGRIEALARDSSGTLWIGTRDDGVFGYSRANADLRHISVRDGLSTSNVQALAPGGGGIIWVGTRDGGLNRFDPVTSSVIPYPHDQANPLSLSSGTVSSILEVDTRTVWVGTSGGLNRLDPATGRVRRRRLPGEPAAVSAIAQDPLGRLWVGFREGGLYCILNDSSVRYSDGERENPRLSDGVVDDIYVDPSSTRECVLVWVGVRGGGVNKIIVRRNPFRVALRNQGSFQIGRGAVLSLCEGQGGVLWVGTWGGGLSAYRSAGGEYKRIATYVDSTRLPFRIPSNDVHRLFVDRERMLWIATGDGLCALDAARNHFAIYRHDDGDTASIAGNAVAVLKEDSRGTLWICTSRGLSRLIRGKSNRFRNFMHADVTDIIEDRSSNLWVTLHGGGLRKFDREKQSFVTYSYPGDTAGISQNWMDWLYEDRRGFLWIWTNRGFVTFDPRAESFSRVNIGFLQRAYVFDMQEDTAGHLWFATGIGLFRLTPATGVVVRYDRTRGFPFNELTSEFFRTAGGSLFVGGLDGFAEFAPDSLLENHTVPAIVITELAVFGKSRSLDFPETRLGYDQNYFSVSFASLNLIDPSRNRFAYRMDGVDVEWLDAGTRHHADYTNLDPGSYVFHVKGSNSEGVWNEEGTSLRVAIAPPYWKTWWFAALGTALCILLAVTAYRYRVHRLLELQRIRLRIARDLHDDIGSNLGAIAFVSRTLQNAPELSEATRRKLTTIYRTAVKSSEGMRDIVWFITPERDNIDDLVLRMKDAASSMLGPIKHKFEDRCGGADVHLSLDFRRNVYLAFKEILTNIVRHAAATQVEIEVDRGDGTLQILIRDNGIGFDERAVRSGNGLESIRNRAKTAGGQCTISSTIGRGTTVTFTASLRDV